MRLWEKGLTKEDKRGFVIVAIVSLVLGAFVYWTQLEFIRWYLER